MVHSLYYQPLVKKKKKELSVCVWWFFNIEYHKNKDVIFEIL